MPMATPKNRRILRLPQTIAKSGLSRDSIYRGGREGWFPRVIKLSERASGWFEDEIDAWLASRAAARDALAASTGIVPPAAGTAPKPAPKGRTQRAPLKKPQRAAAAA
jgi:prophage regulatory protein